MNKYYYDDYYIYVYNMYIYTYVYNAMRAVMSGYYLGNIETINGTRPSMFKRMSHA